MDQVVLLSRIAEKGLDTPRAIASVKIRGSVLRVGLIDVQVPLFDASARVNWFRVLVRKRAFSANYRDKGLLLYFNQSFRMAANRKKPLFSGFGSDFVGEIVNKGAKVKDVEIGDRVISNCAWPVGGYPDRAEFKGAHPGTPSNLASKRFEILHEKKILKIPQTIPDEVAASLPIGAATSYSMVRKLQLVQGANVLVTAGTSNTSIFVINALKKYGVNVFALARSNRFEHKLRRLGVRRLLIVNGSTQRERKKALMAACGDLQFHAVLDVFFDLHLPDVLNVMCEGGRYITCGMFNQFSWLSGQSDRRGQPGMDAVVMRIMDKSLTLIGNQVGEPSDLAEAIVDYGRGYLPVTIDSVFSGDNVAAFLERTYNDSTRFGKVIYVYERSSSQKAI